MATTLAPQTNRKEVAVLQADEPVETFGPIHFEAQLKGHADWAELIDMVHSANELVRLARALIPAA